MATKSHDPFAAIEIETAARRAKAEEQAKKAISTARTKLVLGRDPKSAFFSVLALKLDARPAYVITDATGTRELSTAATDGKRLYYNPEFIAGLDTQQTIGLILHEVMHCSNGHHARRMNRDPMKWNIAGDLAINGILISCGFKLPADGCIPGHGIFKDMPPGKSAEEYYSLLPDDGADTDTGPAGDPGGCGAVIDAGDQSECVQSEADWQIAVAQASELAKQHGNLPAGIGRMVEAIVNPKVDWRDVLRQFVSRSARNDYAWSPPNRRHIHAGLYLPSLRSEELGDAIAVVDCSGSIGKDELDQFAAELQAVLECYDVQLTIIYHDAAVAGVQEWSSQDGPLVMEPAGGGGTDHCPVFAHVAEHCNPPTCMICLTDGYTNYPDDPPPYPVLWVMTTDEVAPWGQTVKMED